jgi:integrase
VAALVAHRAAQRRGRLAAGPLWQQSGYVFTKPDGSPLHPETLTKTFIRLVKATGLPHMRLHDLRHLSASRALAAGVAPAVVSKRLGHAGIGITLDLYSHLIGDAGKSAAALLPHSG